MEVAEQAMAAALSAYRHAHARQDGGDESDTKTIGRADGVQSAICVKSAERAGEPFARNHGEDRKLSKYLHFKRGIRTGVVTPSKPHE